MAMRAPAMRLKRLDLPTFGRPTMAKEKGRGSLAPWVCGSSLMDVLSTSLLAPAQKAKFLAPDWRKSGLFQRHQFDVVGVNVKRIVGNDGGDIGAARDLHPAHQFPGIGRDRFGIAVR